MAYGTGSVPKVDKIFGPGNAWVTAAKAAVASDPAGAAAVHGGARDGISATGGPEQQLGCGSSPRSSPTRRASKPLQVLDRFDL